MQFLIQPWRIEMLGGLRATCREHSITRFRTQKTAALFAYLAYHKDRMHPREVVIEMLWPDVEPSSGRERLRVALTSLRHQLEPPGVPQSGVLVADRISVGLRADSCQTDVREFTVALDVAANAD